MAAGNAHPDRLEQVLAAPQRVVVLAGPARCGKTAAALELYRRRLDDLGRPGCLLIVPNAAAVDHLRGRLLSSSPGGVLIAPAVTTFARLAGAILSACGACPETLSATRRHLLLAAIVGELAAAGELKALAALADAPGLVAALDGAIAELKRAAVEPDALARAIRRSSGKHADLLAVYRRYQQVLRETNRFDVEGQVWLARDRLAGDPAAPLGHEGIAAVAVDGFTDFTPTQLEMLALLSRRAEKVLITLPLVSDPPGRRLWHWTRRTLQRVLEHLPDAAVIETGAEADPLPGLFDLAAAPARGAQAGTTDFAVRIVEAPDLAAEVQAAARAVKARLREGASAGTAAVVARDLETYGEAIERTFAAHGIPVRRRRRPLAAVPVVRYALRLLSLPPDYDVHALLAVLRSSYFRPGALGPFDAATAAAAEMAVRTANVLGGRGAYARALEGLARRAEPAGGEPGEEEGVALGPLVADAEGLRRAAELLEALLSRLQAVDGGATTAEYVQAVRGVVADLEVPAAAADHDDEALVAGDLRALKAFDELLGEVASADVAGTSPAETVVRAAAVAEAPAERAEPLVAVLDVLDARALRFDWVWLLGVNETSFPRLLQERCFIGESDRAAWGRRGLALDRRRDLICREMLLFYLAATRPDRSLTVSFLGSDASGRDSAPSVFLDDLRSAARRAGIAVETRRIGVGRPVPPTEELARPADALDAAVLAAFDPERAPGADAKALLGWAAAHRGEVLARASQGMLAAGRRWREGEVDRFDGRLDDASLLEDLARRIPSRWTFSATALNAYAHCPWSFFAAFLLRLRPLEEPRAEITALDRGGFCHAVLWRLMSRLRDDLAGPVRLADVDEPRLRAALDDAAAAERARLGERALSPALWDAQTRRWQQTLWAYLSDQRAGGQDGPSLYFELGFGLSERFAGRMDPASAPRAVNVQAGEHRIRLEGRIDRVDRVEVGEPSRPALLAVDYKTGALPAAWEVRSGRDLQLALYAAVLEGMFAGPCAGGAYHGLGDNRRRYFARYAYSRGRRKDVEDYDERLAGALATAGRYVQAMREGRFDAVPDGDCPAWCPYRQICHVSPQRARRKSGGAAPLRAEGGGDE